jgi:hypothetical protein
LARASEGVSFERAVGKAQEFLFNNFMDDSLFEQIKQALKYAKTHERALFHPIQLLRMMHLAMRYCKGADEADHVTDEQRYIIGRCCLMTNDLLTTEEDNKKLARGSDNFRRVELMAQLLPSLEVNNPGEMMHVLYRALGTFNLLLYDGAIRTRILERSGGYDFVKRFRELTGVTLESWIAILFCFVAYYTQYGGEDGTAQDYKYLWIDPRVFLGTSGISESDLDMVLGLVARDIDDLSRMFDAASPMKVNVNVTPFKFFPLIRIGYLYICSDIGFLVEKLFAGAYWALHDREDDNGKKRLASAWGILFECYVNWWAQGRNFQKSMTFYPFPTWSDACRGRASKRKKVDEEAFDAVIRHDGRLMVLEYKGGFLTLEAKYSVNVRSLLRDLDKKIAKGCGQLARNLGALFGISSGQRLEGIPTEHITRVIPVIVVQDQALRAMGINWWMNRQFLRKKRKKVFRPEVTVEPLTLIHISEFETMIDSAEGPDFGLLETIQLRNFRDQEELSDLYDLLLDTRGFGAQHSTRRKELESEFNRCIVKYAFPGEYKEND